MPGLVQWSTWLVPGCTYKITEFNLIYFRINVTFKICRNGYIQINSEGWSQDKNPTPIGEIKR